MPPMSDPAQKPGEADTRFAVLLFTDICDSTALKAQRGAIAYRAAAEMHNQLFEQLAAEEKLTLIKNTGDGYFARTTSVAAAVRFALRLQHGLRVMPWPEFPLVTRVGIHAGEVADITTLGQVDVLAPAADLVARIMGLAVGGQILLSRWPFDEARQPSVDAVDVVGGDLHHGSGCGRAALGSVIQDTDADITAGQFNATSDALAQISSHDRHVARAHL